MKFALIGKSISHSLSPKMYRDIFQCELEYELLDIQDENDLPTLSQLASRYDGVNITSPYKKVYADSVIIDSPDVAKLGAINTISITEEGIFGTNTDLIAVEQILRHQQMASDSIHLTILGSGVMAKLTALVCDKLQIPYEVFDRALGLTSSTSLTNFYYGPGHIVVNACSRDFIFTGEIHPYSQFWDYNYNFLPHKNTLPLRVKTYTDGQKMLWIQANAAAQFWQRTNPKLKC
jgi:shikimate 5-dehydrogenase